jgi:YaiO family outer membrane protein
MIARSFPILVAAALFATPLEAQDMLARARTAPSRAEGLSLLATHLTDVPQDVDARLLYALMLSWERRYDEARVEFNRVLDQAPAYTDARAGLMNVEWWSGNRAAAREQANVILARDPGHRQAWLVRRRIDAAARPWEVATWLGFERFNDGRDAWHERQLSVARQTAAGPITGRVSHAGRFGRSDRQFEAEFYPTIRPGTYGFVAVGIAPDHILYPRRRLAFDLYQSVAGGFEISGGYRRLEFTDATSIYVGTVTKYLGNWMLTGKLYRVPAPGSLDSTSAHGMVRRYFGSDGRSFVGFGYSQGLNREEIRGLGDLTAVDGHTLRGQLDTHLIARLRLLAEASTSRHERTDDRSLWQTAVSTGFAVGF